MDEKALEMAERGMEQEAVPAKDATPANDDADGVIAEAYEEAPGFAAVRARLDEIAREVEGEGISLEAALDLYEEAVKLGTKATELLEGQTS